jgi:hypothetical protein
MRHSSSVLQQLMSCPARDLIGSGRQVNFPGSAWRGFFGLLLFVLSCTIASGATSSDTPPHPAADSHQFGVGNTLVGIISYARWPGDPGTIRLCLVGPTAHVDEIASAIEQSTLKRPLQLVRRTAEQVTPEGCEAVYIGNIGDAAWRKLSARITSHPVLTISERGDACVQGSMFCLDMKPGGSTRFEVNLDSIARSGVRVHPQVLRLGRTPRGAE